LGLDVAAFDSCLDSGQQAAQVKQDVDEATRLGVRSTPTFFLNGREIVGAKPFDYFKAEIEAALRSN
jgi:protein-disulfide isomerase